MYSSSVPEMPSESNFRRTMNPFSLQNEIGCCQSRKLVLEPNYQKLESPVTGALRVFCSRLATLVRRCPRTGTS